MKSFGLSADEFADLLGGLGSVANCLNPDCNARLTYRATRRGRQALYCDEVCRRSTWRAKEKLKAKLKAVLESHEMRERPATGQRLRAAEAQLRWLLARYPSDQFQEDGGVEAVDDDHPPLAVIFARMDDDWTEEARQEASRYDARMRVKYMDRRSRPIPVTPTPEARRRAAIAREQRLEVERLVLTLNS